jgi:hypothetical protein
MTDRTLTQPESAALRRRRPPRPLDLFRQVPEGRTAEAMDDRAAAEELVNDLIALVDAGLIEPVDDHGAVRYAPVDPDDFDAAA